MHKTFHFILIILFTTSIFAASPEFKTYNNQKELVAGEAKGVTIAESGALLLSPRVSKIFSSSRPYIWDIVEDTQGNIFVAAGDGARIFRIQSSGKVDTIAVWDDAEVYSLALDKQGNLYAALSPEGKIYKFNKNYQPRLFVDLNVKYIWDVIFDSKNQCFAATGDSGSIYQINEKGVTKLFFKTEETHVRSLAWGRNGYLLAGTYKNGYIYEIDRAGKGYVIYDSDFEEISQLQVSKSNIIYALGVSQRFAPVPSVDTKEKEDKSEEKFSIDAISLMIMSSSMEGEVKITTGILEISPNGASKDVWSKNSDYVTAIYLINDKELFVGSGEKGRLYKIDRQGHKNLLYQFSESQIVSFCSPGTDRLYFATSNLGSVYRLEEKMVKLGTYLSPVIDAKALSQWGTIQIQWHNRHQGTALFYTRSGNTEKPNSTWSSWVKANAEAEKQFVIKSPVARFLQWKLELKAGGQNINPQIEKLKISYLQQNLPPEINYLKIHPVQKKVVTQRQSSISQQLPTIKMSSSKSQAEPLTGPFIPESSRRTLTNGFRKISWSAKDKNNDKLIYSLFIKHRGDRSWFNLKKNLTRSSFTLDSRKMPDGIYQIKLVVSDEKSNPINTALTTEKLSDWFVIDNSGPVVDDLKLREVSEDSIEISFQVTDQLSNIKKVQFSLNIEDWKWVYPIDQVCDSRKEEFVFPIQLPEQGYRTMVIKATDEANNVGYGRIVFEE